jgi:hypothetical protein
MLHRKFAVLVVKETKSAEGGRKISPFSCVIPLITGFTSVLDLDEEFSQKIMFPS